MVCAVLAREYHWSPAQIRELTYQEFVHYLNAVGKRREQVAPDDVNLEYIRQAFFAWCGIKEPAKADCANAEQLKKIPISKVTMTEQEKNEWIAAGYPNLSQWLPRYRRQKR